MFFYRNKFLFFETSFVYNPVKRSAEQMSLQDLYGYLPKTVLRIELNGYSYVQWRGGFKYDLFFLRTDLEQGANLLKLNLFSDEELNIKNNKIPFRFFSVYCYDEFSYIFPYSMSSFFKMLRFKLLYYFSKLCVQAYNFVLYNVSLNNKLKFFFFFSFIVESLFSFERKISYLSDEAYENNERFISLNKILFDFFFLKNMLRINMHIFQVFGDFLINYINKFIYKVRLSRSVEVNFKGEWRLYRSIKKFKKLSSRRKNLFKLSKIERRRLYFSDIV